MPKSSPDDPQMVSTSSQHMSKLSLNFAYSAFRNTASPCENALTKKIHARAASTFYYKLITPRKIFADGKNPPPGRAPIHWVLKQDATTTKGPKQCARLFENRWESRGTSPWTSASVHGTPWVA